MSKLKIVGVIPARYASTRLPGKPLVDICGLPMVVHTLKRAQMCDALDKVIVATDDKRIFEVVESFGGVAMMTSSDHRDANYRLHEVSKKIDSDFYVLINGDEPLLNPDDIKKSISGLFNNNEAFASLLVSPYSERNNISNLKMVLDVNDYVMYISRSDIPSDARGEKLPMWKGYYIVTFRKESLKIYAVEMGHSDLNLREETNENKIIEYGYKIKAIKTNTNALSVDTPEDLEKVRSMMLEDSIFKRYQ